jgi:hypothetical protein
MNTETWTPSKKRGKMNNWLDYISQQIEDSEELDADLNFRKIYLMFHQVKQNL